MHAIQLSQGMSRSPRIALTHASPCCCSQVWKETTELGCGMSPCGNRPLYVCQYSPAGNVLQHFGENVFSPNQRQ
jgi:hypothetical protein